MYSEQSLHSTLVSWWVVVSHQHSFKTCKLVWPSNFDPDDFKISPNLLLKNALPFHLNYVHHNNFYPKLKIILHIPA